jgi:hypothetical protein
MAARPAVELGSAASHGEQLYGAVGDTDRPPQDLGTAAGWQNKTSRQAAKVHA